MTLNQSVSQDEKVEAISRVLHAIYQEEAKRQYAADLDDVRHPDDYDALAEHTKEYDRVLARYILQREEVLIAIAEAARDFREAGFRPGGARARLRANLDRLDWWYAAQ